MNFKTITNNEVNALAPHTFKYSVAIFQYPDKPVGTVSSGTLVQIGSRFFIATAAHNLTPINDNCLYIAYGKEPVYEPFRFVRRKPLLNETEPEFDVGYIEISHDTAKSMNEKEFLPLNRINPFINFWPTRVFLTGFPAEMVSLESDLKNKFVSDAIGYLTETKKLNELKCNYDELTDIVVDYEPKSIFVEKQTGITMPQPFGLSGGGLWALPITQQEKLWTPNNTMLIGIKNSWVEMSNIVRCIQIQYWLKCVAADYPDLEKIIAEYLELKEQEK
jgi:hypothetical protein